MAKLAANMNLSKIEFDEFMDFTDEKGYFRKF